MAKLANLDLNLLKTFDVLMDERNVSRAAQRLSLTQPAVSGMLTRLRNSLDDPLFVRSQHGITPTVRAMELAVPVKRLLQEIELAIQPSEFIAKEAVMTLNLAGTDYSLKVLLAFIHQLRELAPNIRISSQILRDDLVLEQMERGELDIAFMTPNTAPQELKCKPLFNEKFVCIINENHAYAKQKSLTLDQFCQLDHALVSYVGGAFTGITDDVLRELGRERKVVLSVPSFLMLMEVMQERDLIAVVPSRLVSPSSGVVIIDAPLEFPTFSKVMVWHERTHHHPAYQWIRELLYQSCQEHT